MNLYNRTRVSSTCTESGIWEIANFECRFDPLAISLEEGGLLEGWKTLQGDSTMNAGVIATIAVLATLVALSIVGVVLFFTHKRMNRDGNERKISQTSTDQLLDASGSSVVGGHGGQQEMIEAKTASGITLMYNTLENPKLKKNVNNVNASQFDTFPRQVNGGGTGNGHQRQLSTFRPPHHNSPLPMAPGVKLRSTSSTTSVSDCGQRSSGDGGSEVETAISELNNVATMSEHSIPPYATLLKYRNEFRIIETTHEEEEDDDSHYSLIRQPDGQAANPVQSSDDGGYESLHHHQEAFRKKMQEGMESSLVKEQVYQTLRRQQNPNPMTASSGSDDIEPDASIHEHHHHSSSIKGIRRPTSLSTKRSSSPLPLPPPPSDVDLGELYAKVDPAKKKKNRDSASSSRLVSYFF